MKRMFFLPALTVATVVLAACSYPAEVSSPISEPGLASYDERLVGTCKAEILCEQLTGFGRADHCNQFFRRQVVNLETALLAAGYIPRRDIEVVFRQEMHCQQVILGDLRPDDPVSALRMGNEMIVLFDLRRLARFRSKKGGVNKTGIA